MAIKCSKKPIPEKAINKRNNHVWKWWKKKKIYPGRKKWITLEHNGILFAPDYKTLPRSVKFYYDGSEMGLSRPAEEVAGFYAKMLDEKYTKKSVFNQNFFRDWRNVMTQKERERIVDLKKCDFRDIQRFYLEEAKKAKDAKNREKLNKEKEKLAQKFGFCVVDGKIQKVANFRMEPPGLFRGRGNHPKMGKLKKRVLPEDVIINIGKEARVPKAPAGHKWKEVIHNDTVTWLARWNDNILKSTKYMLLHPSSKLRGQSDVQKYELARKLKRNLRDIRKKYMKGLNSAYECDRQKAVAVYFIDRLALRTGYEKYTDTADTVGCCSLRVEHITLSIITNITSIITNYKQYVIHLDFPGKDNIRYHRSAAVDVRVYRNLQQFLKDKGNRSVIFDTMNTTSLTKYLNDLMENLTAKVFRTCNASTELESQLEKLTERTMTLDEKLVIYNSANRSAAILCNHQRAVPKAYKKILKNFEKKIEMKTEKLKQLEKDLETFKKKGEKYVSEKLRSMIFLRKQIQKLQLQLQVKIENKDVALGTSKLNYLDPRISVAWCKKWDVPIEKIYNKTQRERFLWAIDTTNENFKF